MSLRFTIIAIILLAAEVYSFILVRSVLRTVPSPGRGWLMALYLLLTVMAWVSIPLFRKLGWGHFPNAFRNITIAFTIGFTIGKLLVLAIMAFDDVRRLFLLLATRYFPASQAAMPMPDGEGITRSLFLKRLALLLGGLSITGFVYGITNRYQYRVRRVKLHFKNLPASFRGMKMVQISDIHSGSFDNKEAVQKGINLILQEQPDIMFFTGDLVNDRAVEMKPYISMFGQLTAPLGVYSTLGNHDYGDYASWNSPEEKQQNLEVLKSMHGAMGWRLMMNEHIVLEKGGDKIAIIGIENWSDKAHFPKYGDMAKAYNGLPEKNIPFQILLSHDPSHFDAQVISQYPDIDLTLSGHTHGMQFGVEIPGWKWSPSQFVYKKWAGLYQYGKQHLYVNRGFGFLGYPGRLGILPEITVFELS